MTVLRLRRLLLGFVGLCGLGSVSVLVWTFAWPITNSTPPNFKDLALATQKPSKTAATSESLVTQFAPYVTKRLRQPLQDSPPADQKPTTKTVRPIALPNMELLGTITDGTQTWAMLQTGVNQLELCKAGDSVQVGSVLLEILSVEANSILLRHQGNEIRLSLKQSLRSL